MDSGWALALISLWIVVAALAVVVLALARTIGLLQLQLGPMPGGLAVEEGIAIGAEAPTFAGTLLPSGAAFSWSEDTRSALLLFVTPTCTACRTALRDAVRISIAANYSVPIVAVSHGTRAQNELLGGASARLPLVSDESGEIFDLYRVNQTPLGVLVHGGVVHQKAIVNNRDQIEGLLEGQARVVPDAIWELAPRDHHETLADPLPK